MSDNGEGSKLIILLLNKNDIYSRVCELLHGAAHTQRLCAALRVMNRAAPVYARWKGKRAFVCKLLNGGWRVTSSSLGIGRPFYWLWRYLLLALVSTPPSFQTARLGPESCHTIRSTGLIYTRLAQPGIKEWGFAKSNENMSGLWV